MRFLAPEHPVLNFPNKITAADFTGWVQERGLYFPNEWDRAWVPILSANDPGEPPADGGLLIAPVEKGWFVYTGYSWFRRITGRRSRRQPAFCEHHLTRESTPMNHDSHVPLFGSWRNAYVIVVGCFCR